MRISKRITAMLLVIIMVFSMLPVNVFATDMDVPEDSTEISAVPMPEGTVDAAGEKENQGSDEAGISPEENDGKGADTIAPAEDVAGSASIPGAPVENDNTADAAEDVPAALDEPQEEKTAIGTVKVVVENNTCTTADDPSYWTDAEKFWTGTLIDTTVNLYSDSTPLTCLVEALGSSYTQNGAETGYVSEINGLQNGWMATLNDWFTSNTLDQYTVANGGLRSGDEIRFCFTLTMSDVGGNALDSTKTLSALSVSGGTLTPDFNAGRTNYDFALGEGVTSGTMTLVPTAHNKFFQVRVYKGKTYAAADDGYRRGANGASVPISVGDTVQVVVGDPAWDSMSNGQWGCNAENVPAGVYTITVVETAQAPTVTEASFFSGLSGVAEFSNGNNADSAHRPFAVTEDGSALVSTNAGASSSFSVLSLTFAKDAKLSFRYRTSSEAKYDGMVVAKNGSIVTQPSYASSDYSGEMADYADYSLETAAGDVVEIKYKKDSSGDKGSDCLWLKDFAVTLPNQVVFHANDGTEATAEQGIFGTAALTANPFTRVGYRFDGWATAADGTLVYADGAEITLNGADVDLYAVWTKVWNVTFPQMPAGAALTVKQGETVLQPQQIEGVQTWVLADGSYTYSASLFGYDPAEDISFAVSGADLSIDATLNRSANYKVTFTYNIEGLTSAVELKNSEDVVMPQEEDGSYSLPAGAYTYTITTDGYKKVQGTVTVSDQDETVPITLEVSYVWNGEASEPQQVGGIYQIENGQQLAWFAQQVNSGNPATHAVMTADIQLNAEAAFVNVWTPIGTSANAFAGSFDGAGHTISGLYLESGSTLGLFGKIAGSGSVSGLTISGASVSGTSNVGLVAGESAGYIGGITVTDSNVGGKEYVGGIVGKNSGTVEACANLSAVVTQSAQADKGIGGIAGDNSGSVKLCYNCASLVNNGAANYGYHGGIVGDNTGSVDSCYNLGTVSAVGGKEKAYYVGGIVGKGTGTISNCYNAGKVPSGKKALLGSGSATVVNCYYLDSCGATDTKGTSKNETELMALAADLGGSFSNSEGYPILKWQDPNATYAVTLTIVPADAVVELTHSGTAVESTTAENGVYSYTGLVAGNYNYSVSIDRGDYASQSGNITLSKADVNKTIELLVNTYPVTFTLTPADAVLTVSADAEPASSQNGTVTYQLPNGSYTWTVEKFGFVTQNGSFTVDKAAVTEAVTLVQGATRTLTFTGVPEGAVVTVTHEEAGIQTPVDGIYTLAPAVYDYTVKCRGMQTVRGQVTIAEEDVEIPISMVPTQPWDGTTREDYDGGSGTQSDPYQIANGAQLYNLSYQVNVNKESNKYYILTADIDMGSQSFQPIGATSSASFKGYFDGGHHTISNLCPNNDGKAYTGLFGYAASGRLSNVTLDHVNASGAGYTAALVGNLNGATAENCVVRNSIISGTGDYVGGLVAYQNKQITNCAVYRSSVTSTGRYTGAVCGYAYANMTGCAAVKNTVSGTSFTGGLAGVTSGSSATITNSFVRGGSVSGSINVGGMIGGNTSSYANSKLTSCYSTARVTASGTGYGAVAGGTNSFVVTNVIYSTEAEVTGSGSATTFGTGKTDAQLKDTAVLEILGSGFAVLADASENKYANGGYPYVPGTYYEVASPASLDTPAPVWTGKTASWDAVPNAAGYAVVLKKGDGIVAEQSISEVSVDFTTLIDLSGSGAYTVIVTAIGDGETFSSSAAGSAVQSFTVENAEITFAVTAASGSFREGDPVIEVTMTDGSKLRFENNLAKPLPAGTYQYEIKAATFGTVTGEVVVTAGQPQTISAAMDYSPVWDGITTIEPGQVENIYQIANGYELAWFRDKVNADLASGNVSVACDAILTDSIDLGGYDWIPISPVDSTTAKKGYSGTFNGNGKTISGLKPVGNSQSNHYGTALFGYVYTDAVIENLTVAGSFSGQQYTAGVVAILAGGTVRGCVNNANITGTRYVGGVVGYSTNYSDNSSKIIACGNTGTVSGSSDSNGGVVGGASSGEKIEACWNTGSVSGSDSIGGVVGNSSLPVTACYNAGAVTATGNRVGGIVGFVNKAVTECYNTGSVTGAADKADNGIGGIAGHLHSKYGGSAISCFNSGVITGQNSFVGSIVGSKGDTSATVSNCYYVSGTAGQAIGSNAADADETVGITGTALAKARMAGLLGGNYGWLPGAAHPVLLWQNAGAKTILTIDVTPNDADIVVEQGDTVQTAIADEPGVYALADGSFTYRVSKIGFNTAADTVTVAGKSQCIALVLETETFQATFTVEPADAKITVTDANGDAVEPVSGEYRLLNGSYQYTVEKFGYVSQSGNFQVAGSPVAIDPITLALAQTYDVTLAITYADSNPNGVTPVIMVKCGEESVGSEAALELPAGEYTYQIVASGYFNAEGSFTVEDASLNIPVEMAVRTTWDGSVATQAPNQVDDVYQITCAEELAWFAQQVNAGNVGYHAKLLADIHINDETSSNTWIPIGSYSNQYTGTFDGNGKSIRGLNAALFGYNGTGSLVKHLTIYGSVSGSSNVGGFVGASYGSFESCTSYVNVTATGQRVGGIVGILYAGASITNCANYGTVSTSYTGSAYTDSGSANCGGIVGHAYGPVSGSANFGEVSTGGANYGCVGGIAGRTVAAITNSYNRGSVSGVSRTGGIVGWASNTAAAITNCYNTGTVIRQSTSSSTSPFVGAIAGSVTDDAGSGTTVAVVNNCYYLDTSFVHQGQPVGIGYGTGSTAAKTDGEMKQDSFVTSLGSGYRASVESGYPVLAWQGGRNPVESQDEKDVAAAKAALTISPLTISKAMTLSLPTVGEQDTTITWHSSNPTIITDAGVVTLPTDNNVSVTLMATITKGSVSDTKSFEILVKTRTVGNQEVLDGLSIPSVLTPVYGYHENVCDLLAERLMLPDDSGLTMDEITVSVVDAGKTVYPASQSNVHYIAADGTITYFYEDPNSTTVTSTATLRGIQLKLTAESGASRTCTVQVNLPWDEEQVMEAMDAIPLTFENIKGEGDQVDAVFSKSLALPKRLDDYGWVTLLWETDSSIVSIQDDPTNLFRQVATLTPGQEDEEVTLTAGILFNRADSEKQLILTAKQITFTIKGKATTVDAEMQAVLDQYTMDKLLVYGSQQAIDPANVTEDIQLLRPKDLGISGGSDGYKVEVSGSGTAVTVNGYRANVLRPLPGEEPAQVELTVTLTYKPNPSITRSKVVGTITVQPLSQAEIDAEIALMEQVKAAYFEGIQGGNADAASVTENLSAFQEVYANADGELVWVHTYADRTGCGIIPDEFPEYDPMGSYGETYRTFKSSNPDVIKHENLLVNRAAENTEVTISSVLTSQKYGKYALLAPDNAQLQKLYKQPVSVTIMVPGTAPSPSLTGVALGSTEWGEQTFHWNTYDYQLTLSNGYTSITAEFDDEAFETSYTMNGGEKKDLSSGSLSYVFSGISFGENVLVITVRDKDGDRQAEYTFRLTYPRDTRNDLYTNYGGIYLTSHDFQKLRTADADGNPTSETAGNVSNDYAYYYAKLADDSAQIFTLGVDTASNYAHKRYSVDDGATWKDFNRGKTYDIQAPAKVMIQILDDAAYYEGTEGWDGKQAKQFIVWVDGQTEPEAPAIGFPGSGTEEDPYRLENADHFDNLNDLVSDGETFEGKFFQVTEDITLNEGWDGIGYSEVVYSSSAWAAEPIPSTKVMNPFAGHFDGQGHTLTFPSGSKPLFDCVRTATIQNLKIKGDYIADDGLIANYIQDGGNATAVISGVTVLSGTKIAGSGLLGGYASGNNRVTISDCHIQSGVIVGCDASGGSLNAMRIGGIVGDFNGSISGSTCAATVYGKDFVGGIVAGQGQSLSGTVISGCTFSGAVIASGKYVGGISGCGYTGSGWGFANNAGCISIKNCTVNGSISGSDYVGGILGAEPAVVQCWSNGASEVSGNTFTGSISSNGQYVGGIIGYMKAMNRYNTILGNTYKASETLEKGIGGVTYVDTSCAEPTPVDGTTYVNSAEGKTGIDGMSLTNHNREDDPLGADADNLTRKLESPKPAVSKLEITGSYKTDYLQGEALDLSAASFTATWTDGAVTHPVLADITVQDYDAQKLGDQKVRLVYGAAYCEITVTVAAPVKTITVSFTMLGDTAHGDSGTKHTLVDRNLTTWVGMTSCTVEAGSTVLDVLQKVAAANGVTYANNNGYISSVSKNGTTLAAFTNGANSGWMYTLNGVYPDFSVAQQQVKDGDVIVFHYTDDYNREYNGGSDEDDSDAAAEAVMEKIEAIGEVAYTDACKQKIDAARKAYDDLPFAGKKKVTNLAVLEAAEKAYADLKKTDDQQKADEVDRLIGQIDTKVTLDSEKGIQTARNAYDKLTAEQKALVKRYQKLQTAEKLLAELKADETDREKAQEVMDLINGLGKITLQSKDAIKKARNAYDSLTQLQKALVTNYSKLEAAEIELNRLTRQSKYLNAYQSTGDYLSKQELGTGSEWAVLGLLRSGRKLDASVYQSLADYVAQNLDESNRLHSSKSTDNARLILALTAMGKDASNVEGQDLVAGLGSMEYLRKQGINGPIFALIALDSGNYPVPVGDVTRDALVQTILDAQLSDGGFALAGDDADPDITGMALQALAPYYGRKEVKPAINRALSCLSKLQLPNGGFASGDSATSESAAQVIVALTALRIDPDTDARFVKNGSSVLDALLAYYVQGGGFKHVLSGERDGLATQQGYYALTAYARFLDGKTTLYNMIDVLNLGGGEKAPAPTAPQVTVPAETAPAESVPTETESAPVETAQSSFPGWIILAVIVGSAGMAFVIVLIRKKSGK